MSEVPIQYGQDSPFSAEERATIAEIYTEIARSTHPEAPRLSRSIRTHIQRLDRLGSVVARYPSPIEAQTLGRSRRGLDTLVDALCRTTPVNFEFFLPTRALLGQGLDMAEANFYRMLRRTCEEVLPHDKAQLLYDKATDRLRVCLYTKLVEEVLSDIASDSSVSRPVRREAVAALAQIWESRLSYDVRKFFPVLEATWEARQKITVTGGTLGGTQEVFELFREGCDPKFVDVFTRIEQSEDEVEAFREFLFDTSFEELNRLTQEMIESKTYSVSLHGAQMSDHRDVGRLFYEFFRSRHLQAMARKMADIPGPKRTAEGYVMIHFLLRTQSEDC